MKITLRQLIRADACEDQRELFEVTFGKSVEVTEELCAKYAQKFNFAWASVRLLNDDQRKTYYKAIAPHENAYFEAIDSHEKTYDEACASHRKAYDEAMAPHQKAYREAIYLHRKAYNKAIAIEFAKAYNEQTQKEDTV